MPGWGDSGANFIQLSDGESNTLRVKGIPELNAGNSYTFNLVVGKNRIEVASVTVQDWTTGETLTGGQAEEQGGGLTYPIALSAVTNNYFGSVVTTDGNVYATVSDATTAGKTAVAMIAYVSETGHGLAIALADESGTMNWSAANSTCESKAAIGGYSWKLPSMNQWNAMFKYSGEDEEYFYNDLNSALDAAVGNEGSRLTEQSDYWSSSTWEYGDGDAWYIDTYGYADWANVSKSYEKRVRAVLVF